MFDEIFRCIREQFPGRDFIPLHEPLFCGHEKDYLVDCIDSTFVSSVGPFVTRFEEAVAQFVDSRHAIAVVNGTQALFAILKALDISAEHEILTQALTFVATANAIHYTGASPVFLDIDPDSLGLSPTAVETFLQNCTEQRNGRCINKATGRGIGACLPMHTCGNPCRIEELKEICDRYAIPLIEDAAESLGSFVGGSHSGTIGLAGAFSFNGNKIITTGGGGMIVTDDDGLAAKLRHLTTTAKKPHPWEFIHDEIGYNFRMPNLNAALGLAQIEQLPDFLRSKRQLAANYRQFFTTTDVGFLDEREGTLSNFWLNTLILPSAELKAPFLDQANAAGIGARSLWRPMHLLESYRHCQAGDLRSTEDLYRRAVNIPSSVRPEHG
jgi:aminotransferase in exopolysaccharide biosynthesis